MKDGLGNIMKQAQKMQEEMQKQQAEMAGLETTGESGGGVVKITLNGKHEALRVQIDPAVMDDREMLEDLIAAAVNDAVRKIESRARDRMSDMLGGLSLPPGFKLPF